MIMNKKSNESASSAWLYWGLGGAVFTILVVLLTPVVVSWWLGGYNLPETVGVFGDQFGIANALISGFAFAGLLATILQQREDIKLQKRELDESQDLIRRQTFEGTLFQMLSQREKIIDGIAIGSFVGRAAIHNYTEQLAGEVYDALKNYKGPDGNERSLTGNEIFEIEELSHQREILASLYDKKYTARYGDGGTSGSKLFSHYLRYNYNIIRFIHDSVEISDLERRGYIRIFRAQLSDDELVLLFYNGVSKYGWAKFMPLADRYHLFDNLTIKRLAHKEHRRLSRSDFMEDRVENYLAENFLERRPDGLAVTQDYWEPGQGFGVISVDGPSYD